MADTPTNIATACGRYKDLETQRSTVLMMARKCSKLTIPSLIPEEGDTNSTLFHIPYQSHGARGVDNLASKLMLALFPPGASFFRLKLDEAAVERLKARMQGEDPQGQIDKALSKYERAVLTELETKPCRPALTEGMKHLIVAGNVLFQVLPKGGIKMHSLANYVVKRDAEGSILEIVVKEGLSRTTLPEEVRQIVEKQGAEDQNTKDATTTIDLYTWVKRKPDGSWDVHQEVKDITIPESQGTYPAGASPWIPVRWSIVAESDYGRGRCEEFYGDLNSAEALRHSIIDFAAGASKIVWLKDPGGVTEIRDLEEADNNDIIEGNANDVKVLQMEKFADFRVAKETSDDITQNLKEAFLLNSSIQRQAERVTAEEIRFMAGELEMALGGVYSMFSAELQRPLVNRIILVLQKQRKLPVLPKTLVHPEIITGLDGLGRSNEVVRLDLLLQGLGQIFGPEAVAEYVKAGAYITRKAAALSIDVDGVVRSEEEVQQARALKAKQETLNKVAPAVVKGVSDQALATGEQPPQQQ